MVRVLGYFCPLLVVPDQRMKRLGGPEQRDIRRAAGGRTDAAAVVGEVIVEDPRVTARSMIAQDEIDVDELWLRYFGNGGNTLSFEFESFLYGMNEPSALDLDLLGLTIEELQALRKSSGSGW